MTRNILPVRTRDEVVAEWPTLRQSLLASYDNCYLSTLFDLETPRYNSHRSAAGIIFHRVAAEILRTLRRTGETKMPIEEALQILYEVAAQRDIPDDEVVIVPAHERRLLRIGVVKLVSDNEFRMRRLIDIERRLSATVYYPDPAGGMIERTLTGQPDALLVDPPTDADPVAGAIVLDWKLALGLPPKGDEREHADDPSHVSYEGYFQQRMYGFLVLRNFPSVERVRLREFYPLYSVARYATLYRSDLEHLEREFGNQAELLDRALMSGSDGPIWKPSPGKHCAFCARPTSCPISTEIRAREGGITSWEQAEKVAAEFVLAGQVRSNHLEALKAWVDRHGPINVKSAKGRYQLRWRQNKTGKGRTFGVFVPNESDRGPLDPNLDQVFADITERANQ